MTNKITVPSELIHQAIDAIEQVGYQDKFIDYTFVRAVKQELRAALADPVPHTHEWDINKEGTATVCYCGDRSSDDPVPPACCTCGKPTACGKMICEECCYEPLPVSPAGGEPQVVGYMQDRSDGEPLITLESHQSYVAELRSKIKDLCKHPSMSFHQVALLEGVLDYVPDGGAGRPRSRHPVAG